MEAKPLVAILGCGPSGLLAAHACHMHGVPFALFSKKVKSRLGGAMYSHIPIPGIHDGDDQDSKLTYIVKGDADTYQKKVYGAERVPFVSFGNVTDGQVVNAWNLGKMYDRLWDLYEGHVVDSVIDAGRVGDLPKTFDLVFSSAPLPAICRWNLDPSVQHLFKSQPVKILNEVLDASHPEETITYDGTKDHSYYRMSKIFGVGSTEWGASAPTPPVEGLITVNKPIWTNCDCYTEDLSGGVPAVVRIGRFGTWRKGELTFHAYNRVIDTFARLGVIS